jgi:hypothetical protein
MPALRVNSGTGTRNDIGSSSPNADKSSRSFSNVFRKDAEHSALKHRILLENSGCNVLDALAMAQELCLPVSRQCTFATSNVVHSRTANLTFDRLVAIQHAELNTIRSLS